MKQVLVGLSVVFGIINMFIHYDNDPAFWGWMSSTIWAATLLSEDSLHNK